jgi:5-methyltetrahydropteroyltriglutamate--homocysteine methyltransferase
MTIDTKAPARADQVGCLLRPARLIALREQVAAGEADAGQLRQMEDDCIREVV